MTHTRASRAGTGASHGCSCCRLPQRDRLCGATANTGAAAAAGAATHQASAPVSTTENAGCMYIVQPCTVIYYCYVIYIILSLIFLGRDPPRDSGWIISVG